MDLSTFLTGKTRRSLFLPAHSRGAALPKEIKKLLRNRPGIWDLPELPDFGGPLISHGAVAESQKSLANQFGVNHGWYGVNGATGLLQAGLLAMAKPGTAVLMPRNVHRSVIQACVLGDLIPIIFDLPFIADRGHFLPPDVFWIEKVIEELPKDCPRISAVVLVHPSYQGYALNIVPLINQFHNKGWPVIVDEAHGTHFAVGLDELPKSGIESGADLVVHSLHKSAPGLVQTAVLWLQGNRIDPVAVERSIGLLQTTSPSALLLASCEASLLNLISPLGKRRLISRINYAKDIFLKLLNSGLPLIETQDPLRLLLHTAIAGITGFEADEWMMSRGIVAELPEPGCLTFCLGFAVHKGLERTLKRNWDELVAIHQNSVSLTSFIAPSFPLVTVPNISCFSAWTGNSKKILLADSAGKISSDLICPYPPGIPMLIPGELIGEKKVDWLNQQSLLWPKQIPSEIRVLL